MNPTPPHITALQATPTGGKERRIGPATSPELSPILLVEDDQVDAMTVKRVFKEIRLENPLEHVKTGEEALQRMLDADLRLPALILLDLNMPRMNGFEFLQERKNFERARRVPAVVLTTSNHNNDKNQCFDFGAAGYLLKPIDYDAFVDRIRILIDYWAENEFPE